MVLRFIKDIVRLLVPKYVYEIARRMAGKPRRKIPRKLKNALPRVLYIAYCYLADLRWKIKRLPKGELSDRCLICMPVEIAKRELVGRLFFADSAVRRGYSVLLCEPRYLTNLPALFKPGVVFIKDFYPKNLPIIEALKKKGFLIAGWDEEGLVRSNAEAYRAKTSLRVLAGMDLVCAWGDDQVAALGKLGCPLDRVKAVGNPRFDVIRHNPSSVFIDRIDEIKKAFGDFILINSSFSQYNSLLTKEQALNRIYTNTQCSEEEALRHSARFAKQIAFEEALFSQFATAARELASRCPAYKVIIRPHPVENLESWNTLLKDVPSVSIINTGSALPWILAAKVVVHNSCTTGIESFLAGKPTIVFGDDPPHWEECLPNKLGIRCQTIPALCSTVERALKTDLDRPFAAKSVERYDAGASGVTSTSMILDLIDARSGTLPSASAERGSYRCLRRLMKRRHEKNPYESAKGEEFTRDLIRRVFKRYESSCTVQQVLPGMFFIRGEPR